MKQPDIIKVAVMYTLRAMIYYQCSSPPEWIFDSAAEPVIA